MFYAIYQRSSNFSNLAKNVKATVVCLNNNKISNLFEKNVKN